MRDRLACLVLFGAIVLSPGPAAPETIKLWPGPPPGDERFVPPKPRANAAPKRDGITRLALVTEPTLTVFRPAKPAPHGPAVIVCPGGGYNILAWDLEGTEIAAWLNTLGITAAVLQYRVPRRDPKLPHAAPLQDAQRAIRLVRQRAREWSVDPGRIGILGFSAGGNLAVMAATAGEKPAYPRLDTADDLGCRPDFAVPIYPAYLGDEDKPGPLSPLVRVGAETPPMFIAVTHDDRLRGRNAALLYTALKDAGVAAELHIFTRGGHGYGLRPSANPVSQWPRLCADWLRALGILQTNTSG